MSAPVRRNCWPTSQKGATRDGRGDADDVSFTAALTRLGFTADTAGNGLQHRWKRDQAQIDVLIPEGAGERAGSRGGVQGAPTVAAPGTTQALARSTEIQVEVGGRVGTVRRPNLVGALVGKAAARVDLGSGGASGRHCADFVVLASLIAASDFRDAVLTKKDRQRLRRMVDICVTDPTALSVENAQEHLDRLVLASAL